MPEKKIPLRELQNEISVAKYTKMDRPGLDQDVFEAKSMFAKSAA